jgi:hypothetical protein
LKGIKKLKVNNTTFQSKNTDSCGLFTLYFIFERLHNFDMSFDDILEDIFEINVDSNESKVIKFCDNIKNIEREDLSN